MDNNLPQGLETKYYKLEKLVKWEHREQVDTMLLNGVSPHKVSDWCKEQGFSISCLLYTSPSPRDGLLSRMPSSA